jgi:hypothetical protein
MQYTIPTRGTLLKSGSTCPMGLGLSLWLGVLQAGAALPPQQPAVADISNIITFLSRRENTLGYRAKHVTEVNTLFRGINVRTNVSIQVECYLSGKDIVYIEHTTKQHYGNIKDGQLLLFREGNECGLHDPKADSSITWTEAPGTIMDTTIPEKAVFEATTYRAWLVPNLGIIDIEPGQVRWNGTTLSAFNEDNHMRTTYSGIAIAPKADVPTSVINYTRKSNIGAYTNRAMLTDYLATPFGSLPTTIVVSHLSTEGLTPLYEASVADFQLLSREQVMQKVRQVHSQCDGARLRRRLIGRTVYVSTNQTEWQFESKGGPISKSTVPVGVARGGFYAGVALIGITFLLLTRGSRNRHKQQTTV